MKGNIKSHILLKESVSFLVMACLTIQIVGCTNVTSEESTVDEPPTSMEQVNRDVTEQFSEEKSEDISEKISEEASMETQSEEDIVPTLQTADEIKEYYVVNGSVSDIVYSSVGELLKSFDFKNKEYSLYSVIAELNRCNFHYYGRDSKHNYYESSDDDMFSDYILTLESGDVLYFTAYRSNNGESIGIQQANGEERNYFLWKVNDDCSYSTLAKCYQKMSKPTFQEYDLASVAEMSQRTVYFMKNNLYALYGRQFATKELDAIYRACTWYTPKYTAQDFDKECKKLFSEEEQKYLEQLIAREQELKSKSLASNEYPKHALCIVNGSWMDWDNDGVEEQFWKWAINKRNYFYEGMDVYIGEEEGDSMQYQKFSYIGENVRDKVCIASVEGQSIIGIILDNGSSDDEANTLFRYSDSGIVENRTFYCDIDDVLFFQDKVCVAANACKLQQENIYLDYIFDADGNLQISEKDFYEYTGNEVTALMDVPLLTSPNGTELITTIQTGNTAIIVGGDHGDWVYLRDNLTGLEGWLKSEEFCECTFPDGTVYYADSVFTGLLPFVG